MSCMTPKETECSSCFDLGFSLEAQGEGIFVVMCERCRDHEDWDDDFATQVCYCLASVLLWKMKIKDIADIRVRDAVMQVIVDSGRI